MHIKIEAYNCKSCNTVFMAYAKGVECPKCNRPEESNGESFDFVGITVGCMAYHKKLYKQFTPYGWYEGSYSESLQYVVFRAFDYAKKYPKLGWNNFIDQKMLDGEGNEFTSKKHITELFTAIEKELNLTPKERKLKEEENIKKFDTDMVKFRSKEIEDNKWLNRIKKFLKLWKK